MKLLIKNLTGQPVSTPIGTLQPGGSLSHEVPESQLEAVAAELAKLGSRVSYAVGDLAAGRSITKPLTLFVETTGDDSNPGTQAKPFRTIQAALDSLKGVEIAAQVTIQVGAGEFEGFIVDSINVMNSGPSTISSTTAPSLTIIGTKHTLYSGNCTWGSAADGMVVLTDLSKNFVVNELVGKMISRTNGTTVDCVVVANTATTITLSSSVTAWSSYVIYELDTKLSGTQSSSPAAITISGADSTHATSAGLKIQYFDVPASILQAVAIRAGGSCALTGCALRSSSSAAGAIHLYNGAITVSGCFIKSSGTGTAAAGIMSPINATTVTFCSISQSYVEFGNNAHGILSGSSTTSFIMNNSNYILGTSGTGIGISILDGRVKTTSGSPLSINGCSTAVSVYGRGLFDSLQVGRLTGANNTVAINCTFGGRLGLSSNANITGTTEISVDGATSTLAGMRALSPKAFPATPNVYGSVVYE